MKLLTILLFATALLAQTASVTLTWDAMPAGQTWKQVRIYERTGTAAPYTYATVAEVAGDQTTATVQNVTPGVHTYVARAVDSLESADSTPAVTPTVPGAPGGLKVIVNVTVTVQ